MRLNNKAASYLLKKPSKETKETLWSYLKEHHTVSVDLRRPFEQEWLLNIAFFAGKQYTFFNKSAWVLQQLKVVKGRIRNVDNQIMPKVRRQIADAIRSNPIMGVVPRTDDQDDIEAAKVGDKVLRHLWGTKKMKRAWRKLQMWKYITGNAFLTDRWDPTKGPEKFNDTTGKVEYQGDVEFDIDGPFSLGVPFSALGDDEIDQFPWMLRFNWKSLEYIDRVYGVKVPSEILPTEFFDVSHVFGLGSSSSPSKVQGAIVMELMKQPCEEYKKGCFLVGANGKIFEKQDYPYLYYPTEHFRDIAIPGIFWGKATMKDAIPLQKTWNRTTSGIDEFNRVIAKGKGLVPRGSKLESLPDDTHGEWLEYKPVMGHKPEIMTLKSLPRTYDLLLDVTKSSFQDLFSQQEVTRGTNRSDIRSGDMVELLLEQNSIGGVPSRAEDEESIEASMTRALQRIQAGYKEERVLQILGDEGEFITFSFRGADLKNNTDVMVKKESSLPESRVARNLVVERRFERGFYGDPADPDVRRKVMNLLDDAIVKDIYNENRLDEKNARIENKVMFEAGITRLVVNTYDNHPVHIREHYRFLKSRDIQRLKLTNPTLFYEVNLIFMQHIEQHMGFIRAAVKQQQSLAETNKVTPIRRQNGSTGRREQTSSA